MTKMMELLHSLTMSLFISSTDNIILLQGAFFMSLSIIKIFSTVDMFVIFFCIQKMTEYCHRMAKLPYYDASLINMLKEGG